MSDHENEKPAGQGHVHPKGEFKMLGLMFIICLGLFLDSLRSEGLLQGHGAGPGSIPQLVGAALVLMCVFLGIQLFKIGYKEGTLKEFAAHVFDKDVVILFSMLILYGLVVETLHFVPATYIFLVVTMYLLDRKQLIKKMIISAGTLGVQYLIFSTLFRVVLP